ncbi:DNA-binding IclR family transcriptional regulator [Arthrobacter sp. CAN_A214]|uniref:IclR family transcriptional regulator n=1 Tax=Arthrobacter sp. CAN_A214 TaxID=2787720 RepID=UPI0018CBB2B9
MAEQKVESVERALSLLDAFVGGRPRLTLSELAQRTGLYPSTILRLAASLERFGFLHREAEGSFRLGSAVLRLGQQYEEAFDLADYVRPALRGLVEKTEETAAFYVREGPHRVCLYRQHAPRMLRYSLEEGSKLPLDRGASARVLMAFSGAEGAPYDAIRDQGYYISQGERDPETAAVAVPVFGIRHSLIGALGVAGTRTRLDDAACEKALRSIQDAANRLSAVLGDI